jgi:hypothetical protein
MSKPAMRVRYEYQDHQAPTLKTILEKRFAAMNL